MCLKRYSQGVRLFAIQLILSCCLCGLAPFVYAQVGTFTINGVIVTDVSPAVGSCVDNPNLILNWTSPSFGYSFQNWQVDSIPGDLNDLNFQDISGATTANYTLPLSLTHIVGKIRFRARIFYLFDFFTPYYSYAATISLLNPPAVTLSAAPLHACIGGSVNLADAILSINGLATFSVAPTSGVIYSGGNAALYFPSAAVNGTTVTCTLRVAVTGCSAFNRIINVQVGSVQAFITHGNDPTASYSLCPNSTDRLFAHTTHTAPVVTYLWSVSTGGTDGISTPTDSATNITPPTGITSYVLQVSDPNGCAVTRQVTVNVPSGSTAIQVKSTRPVSGICPGSIDTLHSLPLGGDSLAHYTWKIKSVNTGSSLPYLLIDSSTIAIRVFEATSVEALAIAQSGAFCQVSKTITLTPLPLTAATIIVSDNCKDRQQTLKVDAQTDSVYKKKYWFFGTLAQVASGGPLDKLNPYYVGEGPSIQGKSDSEGIYHYTLSAQDSTQNSCQSVTEASYSIVAPLSVDFSSLDTALSFFNRTATFSPTAATRKHKLIYFWTFGDGATGIDPEPSHTYATPGTFTIVMSVTDSLGCNELVVKNNYVTIQPEQFYFPSAFSPNGDTLNEIFRLLPANPELQPPTQLFQVFDKNGSLVYENTTAQWNGTVNGGGKGEVGTYIYKAILLVDGQPKEYTGTVVLLK